jgi:hypothetical protein
MDENGNYVHLTYLTEGLNKGVRLFITRESDLSKRKYILIAQWPTVKSSYRFENELKMYPSGKMKIMADRHEHAISSTYAQYMSDTDARLLSYQMGKKDCSLLLLNPGD